MNLRAQVMFSNVKFKVAAEIRAPLLSSISLARFSKKKMSQQNVRYSCMVSSISLSRKAIDNLISFGT